MRIPKYRKHSTGRGFVEHAGKRHYLPGDHGSPESIAAYKAWVRELCGGYSPTGDEDTDRPQSVAALVTRWLRWAEVYYAGTGTHDNLRHSSKLLMLHYGSTPPADFGPRKLKELQKIAIAEKHSRDYVNSMTARVKRCFKWGVSEELIPASVYHGLSTVPGIARGRTSARESEPRQPVSWEDVRGTLPFVSSTIREMILLKWNTGVRSQSIRLAKPEQFNTTVTPWEWRPRHKMEFAGKPLVIYLGPKAREKMKARIESTPVGAYLFPPATRKNRRYGKHYSRSSFAQAVARGIVRANKQRAIENEMLPEAERLPMIPHWSPHQIRHSKGTIVRAKHGLEAAQATLGHGTIDAAQIYAERQMDTARAIAEAEG